MPLPLTVSCSRKMQIGFTFLVLAHPGSPGKSAVKRVCVCVCYVLHINSVSYQTFGLRVKFETLVSAKDKVTHCLEILKIQLTADIQI